MRVRAILMGFAATAVLAACDSQSTYDAGSPNAEIADSAGVVAMDEVIVSARRAAPAPAQTPSDAGEPIDASVRMLAYEYSASLQLPGASVGATLSKHEADCLNAGPSVCQVISSNIGENGPDYMYGDLDIRASREWMTAFREGLPSEVENAKGRLTNLSARAEDLTRTIMDTTARLDAQRTLRERLITLLERDTDDVGDLLQIEREIARVQGEIESAESYLRVLRARVSMDRMRLDYQTLPKVITPQTTQPLVRAFRDFFTVLSGSLAGFILFVARALPWLVIGLPLLWLILRFANRFRKKPHNA